MSASCRGTTTNGVFRTAWSRSPRISARCIDAARAPYIVVHCLAHAVAALKAGRPVTLLSAEGAGVYAGAGWFAALVAAARAAVPEAVCDAVLDCADDPAAALVAIRERVPCVIFTGRADVAARLADIAGQCGVRLLSERPAAGLDLAADFFASAESLEASCADFLASLSRVC